MLSVDKVKGGIDEMLVDGNNINTCMVDVERVTEKISGLVQKTTMLNSDIS
jgi:hypothetical protein